MTSTTAVSTHEMVAYCDRLWGPEAKGWACLAAGHGPHLDDAGKYRHARFEPTFIPWPVGVEKLVHWAASRAPHCDVYVTPMLRTERSRKKGTGGGSRWLWVDVDGEWTEERERRWSRFEGTGAFMVHSGRGRHLYVPAGRHLGVAEVEERNRKLCALFAGEKWEENAFLRMPGTFNFKPLAAGGVEVPVRVATT